MILSLSLSVDSLRNNLTSHYPVSDLSKERPEMFFATCFELRIGSNRWLFFALDAFEVQLPK
jgi:hypothetical protein